MDEIEKVTILQKHECELDCNCGNCGWNITIGGTDKGDLHKILEFIEFMYDEERDEK